MKKNVMITLDTDVHEKAKERGINISSVCEDSLRQVVGTFDRSINPETCEHNWTLPFTVPSGLAKECKKCGKIQRVEVETHEETIKRANKLIKKGKGEKVEIENL